jgi:glycosyltransferase involved in cell wall biosynthesis
MTVYNNKNQGPLRIAQVAPLWTSVPPCEYGGAELVVHWLTEELTRRGYDVTLFASGDSTTKAKLQAVYPENLIKAWEKGNVSTYECYATSTFAEAIRRADEFDVIHCHLGPAQIPLTPLSKTPCLHTLHARIELDDLWVLQKYQEVPIAAISHSQISVIPRERRNNIHVIYHGCDFEMYKPSGTQGDYLAFLGRMGTHKNPLGAIDIAKRVGLPIMLGGKPMTPEEERYFNEKVRPCIDGRNVIYLGPMGLGQKVELLRGASAFLFPIRWEEPFGLVMIEAMACGTPVVACNRGSVGEVVDCGKTGFYGDSEEELPRLLLQALSLNRKAVREHALKRFSHQRMVDEYVAIYESLSSEKDL